MMQRMAGLFPPSGWFIFSAMGVLIQIKPRLCSKEPRAKAELPQIPVSGMGALRDTIM